MLRELPIASLTGLIEAVAAPMFVADTDGRGKVRAFTCNGRYSALDASIDVALADAEGSGPASRAVAAGIRCCVDTKAPLNLPRSVIVDGYPGDIHLAPVLGEDGLVCRVVGTVTDQSIRRALIEDIDRVEVSRRAKNDFVANMSHELRTPLNAIIGFAQILVDQVFGPIGEPRYVDYLRDIQFSGKHLLNIINDLMDLSKNEAGRLSLVEQPTEIAEVVEASVRLLRERAAVAGVELETEVPDDLPLIWADEQRLRQVIMNLLLNAIKFTPEEGRIVLRASLGCSGIAISISDTGIGIAEEDLEKVMQPFGQVASALAYNREGTGLGLPLSKAFLDLHDGSLTIKSVPGAGTTVTASLPASRLIRADADGPAAARLG